MLEAARDLYALAPAEFTAARNQLAKELKADGQTDDAAIVAKLRKPRMAEWALNRLAREQRDVVDRFALAIAAAQTAQSAAIGGTTGDIREATAELRQATSAAADAAVRGLTSDGGNGEAQRDDLTAILRELVGAADATPLLAGVIGSEALVTSGEFFPGAPDPPRTGRPTGSDLVAPSATSATAAPSSRASKTAASTAASTASESKRTGSPAAGSKRTRSASGAATDAPAATGVSTGGGRAAGTAAARRAMARAERHGLLQAVTAAERAVTAARAYVDAAAAELKQRTAGLETALAAATAAADALSTVDAEDAPGS